MEVEAGRWVILLLLTQLLAFPMLFRGVYVV
jgi:hypothetical protein